MGLKELIKRLLPKQKPLCNPDILDRAREYATGKIWTLHIIEDTDFAIRQAEEKARKEVVRIPRRMIKEVRWQSYKCAAQDNIDRAYRLLHMNELELAADRAFAAREMADDLGLDVGAYHKNILEHVEYILIDLGIY